jgi:hypothetical protein
MRSHIMKERRREQRERQGETMNVKLVEFDDGSKGKSVDKDMDNTAGPSGFVPTTTQIEIGWKVVLCMHTSF